MGRQARPIVHLEISPSTSNVVIRRNKNPYKRSARRVLIRYCAFSDTKVN